MTHVFRLVNSLENLNPRHFAGEILVLPDGNAYQAVSGGDELGGIDGFFKKLGAIALPLVGTIAAPFTGGMSLALTSAINAGGAIGAGLLSGIGGGGASGQAKGLAAIQSAGQSLIGTFGELKKKAASGEMPKADAYAAADKLVSALSDSTYFYPAKKGKDAAALADFKSQAAQAAAEVKSIADATEAALIAQSAQQQQQQQTTTPGTASIFGGTSASASALPFGLSLTELLLIGGGIYFLTGR